MVANKMIRIVCLDYSFVDLMKTILNFPISFELEYMETVVATHDVDVLKARIGSAFLTGDNAQYDY